MEEEQLPNESNTPVSHGVTLSGDPENPNEIEITMTPEMYESASALIERINSQLGSLVTQTFREHLFFVPEMFTTEESQDWYVRTLVDLTKAYGFDRLVNPVLMQKLNMDTPSTIIFNPFITILNEIYTSESRADEAERLFIFCDTINILGIEAELNSTTNSEKKDDMTFAAFLEEKAQEKNRIGALKNLMIVTDIGFRDLNQDPIVAQDTTPFAIRLSKIEKSIVRISSLFKKLKTLQTIAQRNQYLNDLSES